jgi:hypothetical protein
MMSIKIDANTIFFFIQNTEEMKKGVFSKYSIIEGVLSDVHGCTKACLLQAFDRRLNFRCITGGAVMFIVYKENLNTYCESL